MEIGGALRKSQGRPRERRRRASEAPARLRGVTRRAAALACAIRAGR
jgi:hypothetical protein